MKNNERERVFDLLSVYESILTEAQKKALEDHYAYDLSFGEISKEQSISRAAVNENVKNAIAKMEDLESKLHLLDTIAELKKIAQLSDNEVKEKLNELIKEKYGI